MRVFCDTNIILNEQFNPQDYEKVYLSIISIEELDGLKNSETKGYLARRAINKIIEADNIELRFNYTFDSNIYSFLDHKADNHILGFAKDFYKDDNECVFLCDDHNLFFKATELGLPCQMFKFNYKNDLDIYKGYKEVILTEQELADFYQNSSNQWDLLLNEYLLIKNSKGEIIDKKKWTEDSNFKNINYKTIDNIYTGKIKPKNIQQELAFDLLQNKNITIKSIFGKFGSGKDLLMSAHALNFIQKGIYDKVIFVRNNYGVKNSKEVGFLPGDINSKLFPYAMPLADHVGGIDGLKLLIDQGKVELQHLGFIRGRDIKNSIIYCSEAENLTKEHIQLLISRLAEGSTLWLNGDFKQIDDVIFERNNGLKQTINSLKGEKLFGCVEFSITERSESARLAELLD